MAHWLLLLGRRSSFRFLPTHGWLTRLLTGFGLLPSGGDDIIGWSGPVVVVVMHPRPPPGRTFVFAQKFIDVVHVHTPATVPDRLRPSFSFSLRFLSFSLLIFLSHSFSLPLCACCTVCVFVLCSCTSTVRRPTKGRLWVLLPLVMMRRAGEVLRFIPTSSRGRRRPSPGRFLFIFYIDTAAGGKQPPDGVVWRANLLMPCTTTTTTTTAAAATVLAKKVCLKQGFVR